MVYDGRSVQYLMEYSNRIIIGVALGLTIYTIYKLLATPKSEPTNPNQHTEQPATTPTPTSPSPCSQLQQELSSFELKQGSSYEECKRATELIYKYTLCRVMEWNRLTKTNRNQAMKQVLAITARNPRKQALESYLNILVKASQVSRNITASSKAKAYELLGIKGQVFANYTAQLNQFKTQLKAETPTLLSSMPGSRLPLTKNQLLEIVNLLLGFHESSAAKKLIYDIGDATAFWDTETKCFLLKGLSVIVLDTVLSVHQIYSQYDEIQIEYAINVHRSEFNEKLGMLSKYQVQLSEFANPILMDST